MSPQYGLYICKACADDPGDDCGDSCSVPWPADLEPLWAADEDDYWPLCRCCKGRAHLLYPLVALEEALTA